MLVSSLTFAQKNSLDSLNSGKSAKDSVMYSNLKIRLFKSRIGREVYGALFRDVYNSNRKGVEISQLEINPFTRYDGKTIGKITIKKLEIFGPTVNDTTRKGNKFEHFASKSFHYNTQEQVIRKSFLLFKVGDKTIVLADVWLVSSSIALSTGINHTIRLMNVSSGQLAIIRDQLRLLGISFIID